MADWTERVTWRDQWLPRAVWHVYRGCRRAQYLLEGRRMDSSVTARFVLEECPHAWDEVHLGWLGGDPSSPTWDEYLSQFVPEARPYVEAVRRCIEEQDLVGLTGEEAQEGHIAFSDGKTLSLTWRAWGDLMQAIVNKREGYMRYYMRGMSDEEPPGGWFALMRERGAARG